MTHLWHLHALWEGLKSRSNRFLFKPSKPCPATIRCGEMYFITTTIDKLLNDRRVMTQARVVVHTTGPLGPNTPISDNHWSIYLLLAADISIGQICTLLWNKERDAYKMSGGGSGCRYWVYSIIWLLEDNQYASVSSANNLWPNLLFRYSKSGEKRILLMVEGNFYKTGRFAESSTQNTTTATPPAIASPLATSSSPAAYKYSLPTTSATVPSGSSEAAQPYYFIENRTYYYWDTQNTIQVDRLKDI
ncbi:hypothetical protein BKA65DRAFT_520903 [Rhexocercosporidium sp. MPI-PUGE-AT-0058]|nr:hypothetical protein BKA65DRAFT_520903 [Rhexocercosporidium sp. MPI-PUGE-AT-0058]